jgi:hypothetical protein
LLAEPCYVEGHRGRSDRAAAVEFIEQCGEVFTTSGVRRCSTRGKAPERRNRLVKPRVLFRAHEITNRFKNLGWDVTVC